MTQSPPPPPIIVALDFDSRAEASALVEQLDPALCRLKVGKELFTRFGPAPVSDFVNRGFDVFLDLKFHDIPNTTARAVAAAADLGVWMVNVHSAGGARMMEAAARQLESMGADTLLIGVTVLTSMERQDLREVGIGDDMDTQVVRLAKLAKSSGLKGVVCSPREAALVAEVCGAEFLRVTPGIRPRTATVDDQRRTSTPGEALSRGSTHLVIGRPITASPDPSRALVDILAEICQH